jgi:hypothetical protein
VCVSANGFRFSTLQSFGFLISGFRAYLNRFGAKNESQKYEVKTFKLYVVFMMRPSQSSSKLTVNGLVLILSGLVLVSMFLYFMFHSGNSETDHHKSAFGLVPMKPASRQRPGTKPGSQAPRGFRGNDGEDAGMFEEGGENPDGGPGGLMKGKRFRAQQLIRELEMPGFLSSVGLTDQFARYKGSPKHDKKGPAIFAAAMSEQYDFNTAALFAGTARSSGFRGDIVVAVLEKSNATLFSAFDKYGAIQYRLSSPKCIGDRNDRVCALREGGKYVPLAMLRFYMYQHWALQYDPRALIMVSDFRDVFFQSDPFKYRLLEWSPPRYNLVVFQEHFPNKVINRCVFNKGWIKACYGQEGLAKVGTNTVSCSGVTMGTRDGILVYVSMSIMFAVVMKAYGV